MAGGREGEQGKPVDSVKSMMDLKKNKTEEKKMIPGFENSGSEGVRDGESVAYL